MEINRHNYEAFLLDLQEGNLSVDDRKQLQDFLLLNPDCNDEILKGEPWFLEPERVRFPGSDTLKKELPNGSSMLIDSNFDLFSIARMEGDLTGEQEEAHQIMVDADAQKAQQWREWQKTRMIPEPVLLKDKTQLYHRKASGSRVFWISVVSAAAAVALFIVLFRMDPMLPEQEFSQEVLPEAESGVVQDTPDQPDLKKSETGHVEEQMVQEKPDPQVKKFSSPLLFSIKKERELPAEAQELIRPKDDMQARPLRISENMTNTALLIGEATPDRIGPLEISPVPIHLSSLTLAQLAELEPQELFDEYTKERDFSLWTIANTGLKGINRLTGSDISLMASRDEEGEVSGFQLKSKRFSMSRPLGGEE